MPALGPQLASLMAAREVLDRALGCQPRCATAETPPGAIPAVTPHRIVGGDQSAESSGGDGDHAPATPGPVSPSRNFLSAGHIQLREWFASRFKRLGLGVAARIFGYLSARGMVFGTFCSGTDSPVLCAKALHGAVSGSFAGHIAFKHAFSCEKVGWKRDFIRHFFGNEMSHLFSDALHFARDSTSYDDISGTDVSIPAATSLSDIVFGFPCQDVSALNNQRKMNGDVVARGAARTGSVFVAVTEYIRRFEVRGVRVAASFLGNNQFLADSYFYF